MTEVQEDRRGCKCYPESRGYPAYLRKGCDHADNCHVMVDLRRCSKPEGRKAAMLEYHAEAKRAANHGEDKPGVGDVLSKCQRLGVPASPLFAIRNEKPTDCLTAAKNWWAADKRTFPALVMLGDVGQGKTVAAAWCAVEWARGYPWNKLPTGSNERPMVWLDGPRLRELGSFDEAAADLLASAATAQLTIVDDAGRDGSPRAMEALSDVLMERVDNYRPTVLTSNLKGEQFRARYGVALADRLRACAVVPKLTGASMRGVA